MPPLQSLLPTLALLALPLSAMAARPMQTDDARIVDTKACQLETWVRHNRNGHEFWALPACNPTGNLEITLGGARLTRDGTTTHDGLIQGKTLFKPMETDGWGWGLAVGNQRKGSDRQGSPLAGDVYAYLPASFSFQEDRLLIHANLGWQREKASGQQHGTWGLGTEVQMTPDSWLIAETFAQNEGKPYIQLGLRHWIVPNQIQLDATWGDRINSGGNNERWVSLGLRLLSLPFLP